MPDATPISLLLKTKPVATALRAVLNTPRVAVRPTPNGELVLDLRGRRQRSNTMRTALTG